MRARGQKGLWHEDEWRLPVIDTSPGGNAQLGKSGLPAVPASQVSEIYFRWRIKSIKAQNIKLRKNSSQTDPGIGGAKAGDDLKNTKEQFLANMSHEIEYRRHLRMVRILCGTAICRQQNSSTPSKKSSTNSDLNDIRTF